MTVYHGSNMIVNYPDTEHSLRPLDFGKGFYITTVKEQAERWARRKTDICGESMGIVNVYQMKEDWSGLICKCFGEDLSEWIDFVCRCRNEENDYLRYDVIKGQVADDKVFRVVDMYRSGIWDKERALKEIKVYSNYDQIAFIKQKAIEQLLYYESFYEVPI
ncbi:MAG: DUF3990 domain-containing protein [Butyrivibrio sp.]|nr:DUF3990 domain-containing protein [Acetatifactor muris]MCM1558445.1 DUF3990 domain-containing protein [Butyrivibrio sp.]